MCYRRVFKETGSSIALAIVLVTGAAAQSPQSIPDSNAVLGFETPAGWSAKGNDASTTTASSTTTRTQGGVAYALGSPANLMMLTSLPVASTAKALAGMGDVGAVLEVDVLLPTQQGNPVNRGALQLFLSCPSRQLNNALIGKVDFTPLRLGIFTTMKFPIPDGVRAALGGAAFNDLTLQFMLSSPGTGAGTYIFDNLRVHSVALVNANAGTQPPPGYGGSVDLVAIGNTPAAQLFDAAPVQAPDGFHLKLGTAGSTTVQLDLGYDGTPAFTCTYGRDSSDASGKSYTLVSCTGGIQAGDLVGASWARLAIVGGDPSMKLRAQLAKSPVGDQVGGGIIPAMPTFWGDFDGCIPTVVADGVTPPASPALSASCAAQTAEANKIVTDYFNKVNINQFPPNWVVTPTPEYARRHGDGSPRDLTAPPPPPNDPDFHEGGHINEGGDWDAYWRMDGSFSTTNPDNNSGHSTTSFDMKLSAHAVLFGQDLNAVTIAVTEHSDSGQLTPQGSTGSSADGTLDLYVFGAKLSHTDVSPGVGFDYNPAVSADLTVEAQIWVFDLKLSAIGSAGIHVMGNLTVAGAVLTAQPHATIGLHAFGGIGVAGIISGGVDVTIPRLLDAKMDVGIHLSWSISTDPTRCDAALDFTVLVTADIVSDGGRVNLTATFGPCPFCVGKSFPLFSWDPILASSPKVLFQYTTSANLFPLPSSACRAPLNVTITAPSPGANLVASRPWLLQGMATSSSGATVPCPQLKLDWSGTLPGDTLTSATGCTIVATFAQPGPRTINLHAKATFTNPFGQITEEGDATPVPITITPLPAGVYIVELDEPACVGSFCGPGVSGKPHFFCDSSLAVCTNTLSIQPASLGTYSFRGEISMPDVDPSMIPATCTNWTATGPQTLSGPGPTTTIDANDPTTFGFPPNSIALWRVNSLGTYSITMTTTSGACGSGGSTLGTTTVTVTLSPIN